VYYGTRTLQKERKNIYNTKIRSITAYGCEDWQIREKIKNCWLWKWTFGADKQEHLEEKRLEMKY
jgi:hypothetical protein